MTTKPKPPEVKPRPRLKKQTLRGLGFAELDQVQGGNPQLPIGHVNRPADSRYCIE